MSEKSLKYIYTIYGIVTSLLLIVTGILLMVSCVNIYNMGNEPFTRENISSEFSKINIPVYITLVAIALGTVLWLITPARKRKTSARISKKTVLTRLEKRLDIASCDAPTSAVITKEKKLRLILRIATATLCIAICIPALVYVLNFNNFGADYNAAVIAACMWILPCTFVSMGLCIVLTYIENASLERQIKAVKAAMAKTGSISTSDEKCCCQSKRRKIMLSIRLVLVAVALLFIVVGIFNGGMDDVLSKAVNICTECIGLG